MNLFESFNQALAAGNLAALPLALVGGMLAGLNPCCLALYPAAAGACCRVQEKTVKRSLGNATALLIGIALAVASLGVLAAYLGRVAVMGTPFKYVIAFFPILMGIHRLGWIRLPLVTPKMFRAGIGGAFGTGLLLSLIIGPCGTPMLASVLSFAAYKQSFIYGAVLLFLYGIGNDLPVMLVGSTTGGILMRLDRGGFGKWIDPIVGSLLILLGYCLLWRI